MPSLHTSLSSSILSTSSVLRERQGSDRTYDPMIRILQIYYLLQEMRKRDHRKKCASKDLCLNVSLMELQSTATAKL